ncbi:hypothetical protein ACI48J_12075 [Paenibacillus chitinolyticus]|uniref:hypothetical protein n=1 Tax=Paenibacillus chitinolyticus TaxID=79263 RepID=UPI00386C4A86
MDRFDGRKLRAGIHRRRSENSRSSRSPIKEYKTTGCEVPVNQPEAILRFRFFGFCRKAAPSGRGGMEPKAAYGHEFGWNPIPFL